MTIGEVTDLLRAGAPALAGLVSLAHPAAALLRRRRRERQLRELIRGEVEAAVFPLLEQLGRRVEALERRAGITTRRRARGG